MCLEEEKMMPPTEHRKEKEEENNFVWQKKFSFHTEIGGHNMIINDALSERHSFKIKKEKNGNFLCHTKCQSNHIDDKTCEYF